MSDEQAENNKLSIASTTIQIDLRVGFSISSELCRSALACPVILTNWRTKFYRSPSAKMWRQRSLTTVKTLLLSRLDDEAD